MARGAGSFAEEKVNYVDFAFATLFGESFWGQQCLRFPDAWRKCFEKTLLEYASSEEGLHTAVEAR